MLKLEHRLLKIALRVRKQKDKISHTHTRTHAQSENGNDVCRVDMAVTLADCVDTSAWLDATFLWFVMSQSTKQPARAKITPQGGREFCRVPGFAYKNRYNIRPSIYNQLLVNMTSQPCLTTFTYRILATVVSE